jgi:hypothetical protein
MHDLLISPLLRGLSPLYLAQGAFTIWMLVDLNRRGVEPYWFWIVFFFQPIGPWIYFFVYKVRDFGRGGSGWLGGGFQRRPSLEELRHRAELSPTAANRLDLGERLIEAGAHEEALPHVQAMLSREPDHCRALYALARAQRALGRPEEAVPVLIRLVTRQANWGDYTAYRTLIEVCDEAKDPAAALAHSRELARVAPSLHHRCLLAEHLLETGETTEALTVIEQGLEEYRYLSGPSRSRDRRWVGKAKQLRQEAAAG